MKYQCYYNETIFIGERAYIGKKVIVPEAIFDTENEAEQYCNSHYGWQQRGDEWIDNEMSWDEVEE